MKNRSSLLAVVRLMNVHPGTINMCRVYAKPHAGTTGLLVAQGLKQVSPYPMAYALVVLVH